jgi:hypothetical protein
MGFLIEVPSPKSHFIDSVRSLNCTAFVEDTATRALVLYVNSRNYVVFLHEFLRELQTKKIATFYDKR